jgi:hypothetical protein
MFASAGFRVVPALKFTQTSAGANLGAIMAGRAFPATFRSVAPAVGVAGSRTNWGDLGLVRRVVQGNLLLHLSNPFSKPNFSFSVESIGGKESHSLGQHSKRAKGNFGILDGLDSSIRCDALKSVCFERMLDSRRTWSQGLDHLERTGRALRRNPSPSDRCNTSPNSRPAQTIS